MREATFCLFVGCGGEIIGGGLEEEYVTAKSSQVLFTTGARLAGKMRIGIGLGSCRSCRDENKEVKTKTIMFQRFCDRTNIVNSAATN